MFKDRGNCVGRIEIREISGHGEFEDNSFLGYSAVYSR
jgi:hypothetical protein